MFTHLLDALLFEVPAVNLVMFVAMSLLMIAVRLVASCMPAHRASRVNPIGSLRSD